jgi:hypothetical protein
VRACLPALEIALQLAVDELHSAHFGQLLILLAPERRDLVLALSYLRA